MCLKLKLQTHNSTFCNGKIDMKHTSSLFDELSSCRSIILKKDKFRNANYSRFASKLSVMQV